MIADVGSTHKTSTLGHHPNWVRTKREDDVTIKKGKVYFGEFVRSWLSGGALYYKSGGSKLDYFFWFRLLFSKLRKNDKKAGYTWKLINKKIISYNKNNLTEIHAEIDEVTKHF